MFVAADHNNPLQFGLSCLPLAISLSFARFIGPLRSAKRKGAILVRVWYLIHLVFNALRVTLLIRIYLRVMAHIWVRLKVLRICVENLIIHLMREWHVVRSRIMLILVDGVERPIGLNSVLSSLLLVSGRACDWESCGGIIILVHIKFLYW